MLGPGIRKCPKLRNICLASHHYRQAISQKRDQTYLPNIGDSSHTLSDLRNTEPVSLPCKGRAGSSVKSGEVEEAGG